MEIMVVVGIFVWTKKILMNPGSQKRVKILLCVLSTGKNAHRALYTFTDDQWDRIEKEFRVRVEE